MKRKTFLSAIAVIILPLCLAAQEHRGAQLELTVSNAFGREQVLTAGIMEGATTGLDRMIGEAELPPPPPVEVFDARFVGTPGKSQLGTGSPADYRPIQDGKSQYTEAYTIAYQGGQGASGVTVSWGDPLPGRVSRLTVDGADMSGKSETEIPFATGQVIVEITFNYSPLSFSADPSPLLFDANNTDPLPVKNLEIIPQGDPQAGWSLSTDADWLEISPAQGSGRSTVEVAVIGGLRPSGAYNAVIQVRSFTDPARLDVPVTMQFTVGVNGAARTPDDIALGVNYPNPSSGWTSLNVRLGRAAMHTKAAALRIHDAAGRMVLDLSSRLRSVSGEQTVNFDTAGLPAGAYTCLLRAAEYELSRILLVVR